MSLPTPNYVLNKDVEVYTTKRTTLLAGTFVRPIDSRWLPAHITETNQFKWMDKDKEIYCYTSIGLQLISLSAIRRV